MQIRQQPFSLQQILASKRRTKHTMNFARFDTSVAWDFWTRLLAGHLKWLSLLLMIILLRQCILSKKIRKARSVPVAALSPGVKLKDARERFRTDAQSMLLEGYRKHKGRPFYVPSPLGERLMIPSKYVEELKNAPMEEVDFVGTFFEMMEGKYTTMGSRSTLHPRVARLQLNQYMDTILQPVQDEIMTAFSEEVPVTDDWTEVKMADKLLWIVARASSRMFGGRTLAGNKDWLNASLNFATDGFMGAQKIKAIPKAMRPLLSRTLPEVRRIHKHYDVTRKIVKEILDSRGELSEKPSDFLQWMVEDVHGEEKDPRFIADILLKVSFAALHTSAATPMQLLFDLCDHPEYIAPLRAEIDEVSTEHSELDKRALKKLRKLDSFMKESTRFNPLLLITFERIIHHDYTLSDGFIIPAGTHIGSPSQAIAMDPELYPNPEVFDGYRHEKMFAAAAQDPSLAGRTQWASANLENMTFGYGRHACPGRFFADYEAKLIMVNLLLAYDFEYASGQEGRPPNLKAETQLIPNHEAKIRMRRRRR